ncbi:MAG: Uma2 family endonuclease [Hydrogenothermus sp.]|nr:MAG: Uma2 family endonuclease [Hydrogenothermus sp.]
MGLVKEYLPYYTIEDYKLWEGDWELIEGIPFAMAPSPFGIHQKAIANFTYEIKKQLEDCPKDCNVYIELDWIISDDTVLRPDLVVICKEIIEYLKENPEIVVEVISKPTAKKDEHLKYEIYEREKVPYYIIAYPEIKKVRVFKLTNGKYEKYFDSDNGILELQLKDGCLLKIEVENIFK